MHPEDTVPTDFADDTVVAPSSAGPAAVKLRGDHIYEVTFAGRVYWSPAMSQIIKLLNASIADESTHLVQQTMSALVRGKRKTHRGAKARMCSRREYAPPDGSIYVPALSRDKFIMRRRPLPAPSDAVTATAAVTASSHSSVTWLNW